MLKSSFLVASLLLSSVTFAQTVSDDLSWVSTNSTSVDQSPDFTLCDQPVNYRLSVGTSDFRRANTGSGAIFPAVTFPNGTLAIPITLDFNQEVYNLRIKLVDFDFSAGGGNPDEWVDGITYDNSGSSGNTIPFAGTGLNVVTTAGSVSWVGANLAVESTVDNSDAWLEFSDPISSLTFTYNRPGNGFGLILDSLEFNCDRGCQCPALVRFSQTGPINSSGVGSSSVSINSNGEAISSLTIEMPAYQVLTRPECRVCDVTNPESFGSFSAIPLIAGTPGIAYEPYGSIGGIRKVTYNFPSPIVLNENVTFGLQFPPSLNLTCCKNSVNYCLNVTLTKDDCTSCDYDICTGVASSGQKRIAAPSSGTPTKLIDGPVTSDLEIDELQLNLSPNPTSKTVFGKIGFENFESGDLQVADLNGVIIHTQNVRSKEFQLDLNTPGTYIFTLTSNGKRSTKKVVVTQQ